MQEISEIMGRLRYIAAKRWHVNGCSNLKRWIRILFYSCKSCGVSYYCEVAK
jgi:hypothetical protein